MTEPIQEQDERAWAELGSEQEQMYTAALERCLAAGANPDDVQAIAAGLGVQVRADTRTKELFA